MKNWLRLAHGGLPRSRTKRRAIGKSSRKTGASSRTNTSKISVIANARAIGSESANDTSRLDRDSSRRSKNRTVAEAIKRLFQAAAKACGARDDEQELKARKRRSGEKESGAPIRLRAALASHTKIAARGRYAILQPAKAEPATLVADPYAGAGLYLADTLGWLQFWDNNVADEQRLDDGFNCKQNLDFPQP